MEQTESAARACPLRRVNRYRDVHDGEWFQDAVGYVTAAGLVDSTGRGRFSPRRATDRSTLAVCLWRLAGKPACRADLSFTDVPGDTPFAPAVRWAVQKRLLSTLPDGRFCPGAPVTREQVVLALYRYARLMGCDTPPNSEAVLGYQDYAGITGSAAPAMSWAVGAGLIWGSDRRLRPQRKASRAELAAMLQRFRRSITQN